MYALHDARPQTLRYRHIKVANIPIKELKAKQYSGRPNPRLPKYVIRFPLSVVRNIRELSGNRLTSLFVDAFVGLPVAELV